jgi:seryl-tRNA synthetase
MLIGLKKSLDEGVGKVRWISSLLSERLKVEMAVIKLLRESDELEKRRNELIKDIGERVYDLKDRKEMDILGDPNIKTALKELEPLDEELKELKEKASEIGKAE